LPGAASYLRAAILLLRAAEEGPLSVVTHRNADPDAVAAAYLAWKALEALGSSGCIFLPEGLSKASKRVLAATGVTLKECHGLDYSRAIIVVDSSNSTQLGEASTLVGREGVSLYLIDHHSPGDLAGIAKYSVLDPSASSTTQIIALALDVLGVRLTPEEATLALSGIVYDTRRFLIGDQYAFKAASLLVSWGGDYDRVMEILQSKREGGEQLDYSERIARLKAAQRIVIGRACNDIIIVVTRVSAFESSAARGLIDLGADIAVVVGGKGGELRVSLRLSRRALKAGLRGSELASYIAEKFGGKGGGHEAAAMAHIRAPNGGVDELVSILARSLPGKVARICVERRSKSGEAE